MSKTDVFSSYPTTLRAGGAEPAALYGRVPDLFAIHGRTSPPPQCEALFTLDDPPVIVCRGRPETLASALRHATLSPVYSLRPGGPPAVPTGLVLVRFVEGMPAQERRAELANAGFELQEVLGYAPHTAWVRARHGGIAAALRGVSLLEALPDVVNVEPQMLTRRAAR